MKIFQHIFLFFLLVILCHPANAEAPERKHFYPIPDVAKGIDAEFYSTEGYVIAMSECECPKGVQCGPCPPQHIIVADKMTEFHPDAPGINMTYYTNDAQSFEVGKKYMFLIRAIRHSDVMGNPSTHYITDYREIPESGGTDGKK